MQERFVRVEAPHFVASYVIVCGVVTEAAPVLSHFIGWRDSRAKAYARRQGWRITAIGATQP